MRISKEGTSHNAHTSYMYKPNRKVERNMQTSKHKLLIGFLGVALAGALLLSQGALASTVFAQDPQPIATAETIDTSRTITVVGKGVITTRPDTAQATLGVETVGDNVKEATAESGATMEAIIQALTDLGIAERDIQTSGFSVWSERNSGADGTYSSEPTYRVTNTVTVDVRDLDQLGTVLDAAIDAGANSIYGVSFYLEDTADIETQAREKAMSDARAKATELATLADVELGKVISVSEVISGSAPYTSFNAKEASVAGYGGGVGPISAGELDMSLTLQVSYAIQ